VLCVSRDLNKYTIIEGGWPQLRVRYEDNYG